MNVFWRELRFYRKSLALWSLGMVILVWSSMVKYDTFETSGQSITELISQFPETIQTIFGFTGFDLSKASGFFGVMFMYLALAVTIHAVMLGAGIISKEERDKTSEFLFVKPITRAKIITAKISASLISIVILNLVTYVSSIYYVGIYSKDEAFNQEMFLMMLALFILQVIFFAIGTVIASISRRPKLSSSIAAGFLLLTFIITYIINFNQDFDFMKYLTPFKYFEAKDILSNSALSLEYLILSGAIVGVSIVLTYLNYIKRDLDV